MFNFWKIKKPLPLANLKVDYDPTEQSIVSQRGYFFVPTRGLHFVVYRFIFQIDWI
jgi:hypothetical protein